MCSARLSLVVVAAALAFGSFARAQLVPKALALPAGELLVVVTSDPARVGTVGATVLLAVDPTKDGAAIPVLEAGADLEVVARIGRDGLLVCGGGELTGYALVEFGEHPTVRPLGGGRSTHDFLGIRGNEAFVRDRVLPRAESLRLVALSLDHPAPPRVVTEDPVVSVLDLGTTHALVRTRSDPPEIRAVALDGTSMKVLHRDAGLARAWDVSGHFSPDGKLVALGVPGRGNAERPFGASTRLLIVDLESGEGVREFAGMDLHVSPLSSLMPALEYCWLDATTIRWSETRVPKELAERDEAGCFVWVDADVRDGRILAERPYTDGLRLRHEARPGDPRIDERFLRLGLFDVGGGSLSFADAKEIAVDTFPEGYTYNAGLIRVSPSGRFAAAQEQRSAGARVVLADGAARTLRTAVPGSPRRFSWLAAP